MIRSVNVALPDLLHHPLVTKLAERHQKSSAQILLRYVAQLGVAVIPKSVSPERLRNNFQVRRTREKRARDLPVFRKQVQQLQQ